MTPDSPPELLLELKAEGLAWPSSSSSSRMSARLRRSTGLVAPHYRLVVRNGDEVSVNRTVPFPTCLFEGQAGGVKVAVSTCRGGKMVIRTPHTL